MTNIRERVIIILKKINMKNIYRGIDTFNKAVQTFGKLMNQLSKEFGSSNKGNSSNDEKNLEKLWGNSSKSNVKIWSDNVTRESKSEKSKDQINLKKIWGDKFEV